MYLSNSRCSDPVMYLPRKILISLGVAALFCGVAAETGEVDVTVETADPGWISIRPADANGLYFILYKSDGPSGTYAPVDMNEVGFLLANPEFEGFFRVVQKDVNSPGDFDEDSIDDLFEIRHSPMDPFTDDAGQNFDEDSLTNLEEYGYGTHPGLADTDGDGFADDDEINAGSSPLLPSEIPVDKNWRPTFAGSVMSALNMQPTGRPNGSPTMTSSVSASVLNDRPVNDPNSNPTTAGTLFVSINNVFDADN